MNRMELMAPSPSPLFWKKARKKDEVNRIPSVNTTAGRLNTWSSKGTESRRLFPTAVSKGCSGSSLSLSPHRMCSPDLRMDQDLLLTIERRPGESLSREQKKEAKHKWAVWDTLQIPPKF